MVEPLQTARSSGPFRRGLLSGAAAIALLGVAVLPARLFGAMRGHDSLFDKATRALAGVVLDLSAVILLAAPAIALSALLMPLAVRWLRRPWWQQLGALLIGLPMGFALWVLTVTAQQVKSERGAFPTMFDLAEGGTNASFVGGTLGFVRYDRIWMPALAGITIAAVVMALVLRSTRRGPRDLVPWGRWALGMGCAAAVLAGAVPLAAAFQAAVSNRFSAAALGDPLTGLVESSFDLVRNRGPATPRDLVLQANLPATLSPTGAARMGWPPLQPAAPGAPCWPHPHARPLDPAAEPEGPEPRGLALVKAFQQVSQLLLPADDPKLLVFQLSLESFRADDIHALNPAAPVDIDPFVNGLYDAARRGGREGVLASSKMFQAGVRTAQGLGALTCGVGTLPYNLSFIRDLRPFPMRCAADVLSDVGFRSSFFYGSDVTFDDMHLFLKDHHFGTVEGGAELPKDLPRGVWGGATDLAVFDHATRQVAAALVSDASPQFAVLMSLSNHSPYTAPEDLPQAVIDRVDHALKTSVNRVDDDDRRRLLTHAYTDSAIEHFFARLDELELSARSIVLLSADHSTGEAYVWGPETGLPDTENAKAQIPFAIVIPQALLARAADRPALEAALAAAQALLDEAPLSQNDVPTLLLALLSAHPGFKALPASARWHSMGGQVTSPWFRPGGESASYLLGINGVSEMYTLDRAGQRVGSYEDSVFLKTRADRYRVTPRLIPVTATLVETMQAPTACSAAH